MVIKVLVNLNTFIPEIAGKTSCDGVEGSELQAPTTKHAIPGGHLMAWRCSDERHETPVIAVVSQNGLPETQAGSGLRFRLMI